MTQSLTSALTLQFKGITVACNSLSSTPNVLSSVQVEEDQRHPRAYSIIEK